MCVGSHRALFHPCVFEAGWESAWRDAVTPWETGRASAVLVNLIEQGGVVRRGSRVLVPGCGTVSRLHGRGGEGGTAGYLV